MLIHEACHSGSRLERACNEAEIDLRTYRRWYQRGKVQADERLTSIRPKPVNKLSEHEWQDIIDISNAPEYASLPPIQIMPILLDKG
ncbi:hypothetical protein [Vibrio sp. 10N.261.51.F12]|uniref:hypothetical protein n=1 Tax=Vibrio sp. 10N.261.51.F12 TaxID=3229679 RepID=UPI0035589D1F